jgi:hypothetical protein
MGCSCRVPVESYPENAEWGPLFWKVLHGLAERCGKQKDINIQADEIRLWIHLLTQLRLTLPCDICRNHYSEWLVDRPVDVLKTMKYSEIGLWIRKYLWTLHNTINEGNEKPTFDFDSLSVTYGHIDITTTWKALEPVMKKAIRLSGISLFPWTKWLSYVRLLQSLY